jgi:NADH-quinone oxidoreductase subunit L
MGLTFWGASRVDPHTAHHVHEVPGVMKWPLVALAVLALAGGFLSVPASLWGNVMPFTLESWLHPVFTPESYLEAGEGAGHAAGHAAVGEHSSAAEYGLMALAIALAAGALVWTRNLYDRQPQRVEAIRRRFAAAHRVLLNKYWVDELYEFLILRNFYRLCRAAHAIDVRVVDGAVHLVRNVTIGTSYLSVFWDTWVVDGLVNLTGRTIRAGSGSLRRLQTGMAQSYATAMVLGLFVLICVYMYMS